MIISKTPLRVTFGGGCTDFPSYYSDHGGFLVNAAIDKYTFIILHRKFDNKIRAKYSICEVVDDVEDLKNPIIKEALKSVGSPTGIEIVSLSDIPKETQLGQTGSYTVGLLEALNQWKNEHIPTEELATKSCNILIDILKKPVGKQDPYIAAYGGITCFDISKDGEVKASPLQISSETTEDLEKNILFFFTDFTKASADILGEQLGKGGKLSKEVTENLHKVKDVSYRIKDALEKGDTSEFGKLLSEHWRLKKERSPSSTTPQVDKLYSSALENGAIGGKLVGAGGGGFLMFYAEDAEKLRETMAKAGAREMKFGFDFEGSRVMLNTEN
ncbi:TPA: galactokinase [archaeon]|nr:galactokinase [Candidatus Undinarchaeales archaeon SRR5007147.bin71]